MHFDLDKTTYDKFAAPYLPDEQTIQRTAANLGLPTHQARKLIVKNAVFDRMKKQMTVNELREGMMLLLDGRPI